MKEEGFFKKHRKVFIGLILTAAVLLVLLLVLSFRNREKKSEEKAPETASIERRTVVKSVSAAGTVVAADSVSVKKQEMLGQKILSVPVQVGDRVNAGDVLCVFDTDALMEQKQGLLDQIEEQKEKAAERWQTAEATEKLTEEQRQKDIADVQESLAEVEGTLDNARTAYSDAVDARDQYIAGGGAETDTAALAMEVVIRGRQAEVSAAEASEQALQNRLQELQAAQTGGNADLSSALSETFDRAGNAVISALSDSVAGIDGRIAGATVRAEAPGLVTEVKASAGDTYTGGVIAVVENDTAYDVDCAVDEYDIPDVAVGMKAVMKTDATREEELKGSVSFVAPKPEGGSVSGLSDLSGLLSGGSMSDMTSALSSSTSSRASYKVRIHLDGKNDRLRLGMNVRVSIVTQEAENVLTVPYDAVQKKEDGTFFVEAVIGKEDAKKTGKGKNSKKASDGAETEKIPVQKGIEGTYYTEVISDRLAEGMEVVVPENDSDTSVDELLDVMGAGAGI